MTTVFSYHSRTFENTRFEAAVLGIKRYGLDIEKEECERSEDEKLALGFIIRTSALQGDRNHERSMTRDMSAILVSGCPRSGTTWLGKVLSKSPGIRYVHEPFNVRFPHPSTSFRSRFSFEHLTSDDEERLNQLQKLFKGHGKVWTLDKRGVKLKELLKWYVTELRTKSSAQTLIKDPIAFLSLEALAERFQPRIVVIGRRPESIIASHMVRGWDFANLKTYVETMRPLNIWTDQQLDKTLDCEDTPVQRVAHMWRLLALWQIQLQERHPDWIFVRYEDLAREPEQGFRSLCTRLGLAFNGPLEAYLASLNKPSQGRYGTQKVLNVNRSRDQLKDPDKALEPDLDRQVKTICRDELGTLYPETLETLQTL